MLSRDLQRHADLRRALGFKFRTQHALLRLFVSHAETLGDEFVDGRRVIDWAAQAPSAAQRRNRLLTGCRTKPPIRCAARLEPCSGGTPSSLANARR